MPLLFVAKTSWHDDLSDNRNVTEGYKLMEDFGHRRWDRTSAK